MGQTVFMGLKRKSKIKVWLTLAAACVLLLGGAMLKRKIRAGGQLLSQRIHQYTEEYGNGGMLENETELAAVLDKLEKYIAENKHKLWITTYERTKDAICVRFFGGLSMVLKPQVKGYD